MWKTIALVAALVLAPGRADALTLSNVRGTYGILGAPRADTKFLPGDQFVLSFDIEGVQVDDGGKVLYSIAMEVLDTQGKSKFKQAPRDLETLNALGGTSVPGYAELKIGADQPPGKYQMKVTVSDRAAKTSQAVTRDFEILPKTFGLVRLTTTSDPEAAIPAPFMGEGQTLWISFGAVGFDRDSKGQPNLTTTLRVLDDAGRPTIAKPLAGEVKDNIPKDVKVLPMQFALSLNRAGKFTVEVKATDKLTGKSATLSVPIQVLKPK
jgi:hypothetical protein